MEELKLEDGLNVLDVLPMDMPILMENLGPPDSSYIDRDGFCPL